CTRMLYDRMKDCGVLTAEDAISYSITGPMGRASGINYDVRRDFPYFVYNRMEFDVPLGEKGDNCDRYLVRMEEMRQSVRIIRQAMKQMQGGAGHVYTQSKVGTCF